MAKEWILNSAINRWGLQKKKWVGAVSEEIRKCSPKTVLDWEKYYYDNVRSKEHLIEIGKKLYIKITEVLRSEIDEITEDDCINYVINLVINRTFEGYITEKKTVYEQLQESLSIKIMPAPDEWDRLYNVDFYIQVSDNKFIGLQIKPISFKNNSSLPELFKEKNIHIETHKKFSQKYGGNVFYVFSIKDGDKKRIYNPEVIDEIKKEIERLKQV